MLYSLPLLHSPLIYRSQYVQAFLFSPVEHVALTVNLYHQYSSIWLHENFIVESLRLKGLAGGEQASVCACVCAREKERERWGVLGCSNLVSADICSGHNTVFGVSACTISVHVPTVCTVPMCIKSGHDLV